MAQSGYSPISLYYSTTASATPSAGNLVSGELAINITDGILFYKDNAGVVQTLATKAATSGTFTSITLSGGTANGVAYLNASKQLVSGSALTFDGTKLGVNGGIINDNNLLVQINSAAGAQKYFASNKDGAYGVIFGYDTQNDYARLRVVPNTALAFSVNDTEQMRLTSTGLGIGTSAPAAKLDVAGTIRTTAGLDIDNPTGGAWSQYVATDSSLRFYRGADRLTLDSSGNLGIGTSSPGARLEAYTASTGVGGWSYSGQFTAPNYPLFRLGATTPNKYASIGNNADGSFTFLVNGSSSAIGTEVMYLNASGNLGLGVTPSAWSLLTPAFQLGATGSFIAAQTGANAVYIGANAYFNGTNWIYKVNGTTSYYSQYEGQHYWYTAPSGTAGNSITFTQAMTLDASGNLGVGTTSPSARLQISATSSDMASAFGNIAVFSSDSQAADKGGSIGFGGVYTGTSVAQWSGVKGGKENSTDGNYAGYLSFFTRANGGSTTERARIDSSGNFGLGVTPSAWGTTARGFDLGPQTALFFDSSANGGNGTQGLLFDAYYNSGYKYKLSGAYAGAYEYSAGTGAHTWKVAGLGTAGNTISFTQAMTLDASGNLGVGTTSPASYGSGYQSVHVNGTNGGYLRLSGATSAGNIGWYDATPQLNIATLAAYPITFGTNNTERARIDSSGNLLVGTTSTILSSKTASVAGASQNGGAFQTTAAANTYTAIAGSRNGNNGNVAEWWYDLSTQVGTISVTGSATSYNTSSDYRLKDNQQPLTGSGAFIDALQPKTWNWKADGSKGVGFIAHEVQEVSPGSVVGAKDAVDKEGKPIYQAMEYGSAEFIANIIAELQSVRKRLAALEGK